MDPFNSASTSALYYYSYFSGAKFASGAGPKCLAFGDLLSGTAKYVTTDYTLADALTFTGKFYFLGWLATKCTSPRWDALAYIPDLGKIVR